MLLTIHNLPAGTVYGDVKELIISKCGLKDCIVDNLVYESGGMKVTVGVMEEEDAALVVRKINGLFFKGQQLYVEDKRQKKDSEQPYRANIPQVPNFQMSQTQPQYEQGQMPAINPWANQMAFMYQSQAVLNNQNVQNPYMMYGQYPEMVMSQDSASTDNFGKQGIKPEGYNQQGSEQQGYQRQGYGQQGFEQQGFQQQIFQKQGYKQQGHNNTQQEYGQQGFGQQGYEEQGFKQGGYEQQGLGGDQGDLFMRRKNTTRWDDSRSSRDKRQSSPSRLQSHRDSHHSPPDAKRPKWDSKVERAYGNASQEIPRTVWGGSRVGQASDRPNPGGLGSRDEYEYSERSRPGGGPNNRDDPSARGRPGPKRRRPGRVGLRDEPTERGRRMERGNRRTPSRTRPLDRHDSERRRPGNRQDSDDRRNQPNRLDFSDRRNQPHQQNFPDNRNHPNRQNFPDKRNQTNRQDFPDHRNQPNRQNSSDCRNQRNRPDFVDHRNQPNRQVSADRLNRPDLKKPFQSQHKVEPTPKKSPLKLAGSDIKYTKVKAMRLIMFDTIKNLVSEKDMDGPSITKTTLRKCVISRVDEIPMDDTTTVPDIIAEYRRRYPESSDNDTYQQVISSLQGNASFPKTKGPPLSNVAEQEKLINMPYSTNREYRVCVIALINRIVFDTAQNLNLDIGIFENGSLLATFIRKAVQVRAGALLRQWVPPHKVFAQYRSKYPHSSDAQLVAAIENKIKESDALKPHQIVEFVHKFAPSWYPMNDNIFKITPKSSGPAGAPTPGPAAPAPAPGPAAARTGAPAGGDAPAARAPDSTPTVERPWYPKMKGPAEFDVVKLDRLINMQFTNKRGYRDCVQALIKRLYIDTIDNLKITPRIEVDRFLTTLIKKSVQARIGALLRELVPPRAVFAQYRAQYPRASDREMLDAIQKKIIENPAMTPDEVQAFAFTFAPGWFSMNDNVFKVIPKTTGSYNSPHCVKSLSLGNKTPAPAQDNIPSYPDGDKKKHITQKKQYKQELQGLVKYEMNETFQKVMDEEIDVIGRLIEKIFSEPLEEDEELFYKDVNKEDCIQTCKKFLSFHVSKRVTDGGLKLVRIYGQPRPPRRPQLQEYLRQFNCLTLKKSVKAPFYTASFEKHETVDYLCEKSPFIMPDMTSITFKQMHVAPKKPKKGSQHWNALRKHFINQLIDKSQVNLLDKDWPAQEEAEKKARAEKEAQRKANAEKEAETKSKEKTEDITQENDSDVIHIEEEVNTIDITSDDASVKKDDGEQFLSENFKVIDEVRASDDETTKEKVQETNEIVGNDDKVSKEKVQETNEIVGNDDQASKEKVQETNEIVKDDDQASKDMDQETNEIVEDDDQASKEKVQETNEIVEDDDQASKEKVQETNEIVEDDDQASKEKVQETNEIVEDDDQASKEKVQETNEIVDDDWDVNGDDWDVDPNEENTETDAMEIIENKDNAAVTEENTDAVIIANTTDKNGAGNEADDDDEEMDDDEEIGENVEDINIADLDWDNVDEDDLEDY